MARKRVKRLFPIALSAAACADAMSLPPSFIARAVANGELVARGAGRYERITVLDLHQWWHENHPRVTKLRRTPHE